MICLKCGRVVRPGNTIGRNESVTERRYYCSCGFVNRTAEQVVLTWRKTQYKSRVAKKQPPEIKAPLVNQKRNIKRRLRRKAKK